MALIVHARANQIEPIEFFELLQVGHYRRGHGQGRAAPHAHQCTFGRAEERGMRCFLGNALPACRELLKTFSVESLLRRTLSAFGGKADIQLIPFDVCF